ncbi:hypothetical protein [Streptomyces tateyamensis]|uniref:hypothetical protein n=1 Tax=Streptomyces tateyamensis TaxID=565073 RepID=UPI0011B38527|nr:hypothetical protein [Streptomyces tateyamensis]
MHEFDRERAHVKAEDVGGLKDDVDEKNTEALHKAHRAGHRVGPRNEGKAMEHIPQGGAGGVPLHHNSDEPEEDGHRRQPGSDARVDEENETDTTPSGTEQQVQEPPD